MSIEELEFKVISNEIRDKLPAHTRQTKKSPLFLKLVENETVFVPITENLKENALNKFYTKATKLGKKLNKRKTIIDDVEGYAMWFSDQETI